MKEFVLRVVTMRKTKIPNSSMKPDNKNPLQKKWQSLAVDELKTKEGQLVCMS
jgi:hypothetical protein